ncbi:hypothetical protein TNCV_4123251 [Trichonephila clavipes]|nr:hypothetical protein TNCV_4123251 [Trichonephila clavipes]
MWWEEGFYPLIAGVWVIKPAWIKTSSVSEDPRLHSHVLSVIPKVPLVFKEHEGFRHLFEVLGLPGFSQE